MIPVKPQLSSVRVSNFCFSSFCEIDLNDPNKLIDHTELLLHSRTSTETETCLDMACAYTVSLIMKIIQLII